VNRGEFPAALRIEEIAQHQGMLYMSVTTRQNVTRGGEPNSGVPVDLPVELKILCAAHQLMSV
jgi:hypothetical protein